MRIHFAFLSALGAALMCAAPAPVQAQDTPPALTDRASSREKAQQERAYEQRRAGQRLELRRIEVRVVRRMRGYQYLGPEPRGTLYRFKFMRDGRVVWIDVDPRTGRIVNSFGD